MKKITIIIFLILSQLNIFAQADNDDIRTIFKKKKGRTFIVAQKFQYTQLNTTSVFLVGAGGGTIFKHKFLLGGGGYGTIRGVPVKKEDFDKLNLTENISHSIHFGYGGFWTSYIFNWQSPFHIVAGMFWAGGGLSIKQNDTNETVKSNFVYILQPMIELELNINEFTRISIAPEYRYVGNIKLEGYKSSDFSSFGIVFFIKFGAF